MNILRISKARLAGGATLCLLAFVLASCKQDTISSGGGGNTFNPGGPVNSPIPKAAPVVVDPADNPSSDAKVELGRRLFYDKDLSVDGSTSCGSCHQPSRGFADVFPTSRGMQGQHGNRNAPTLTNVAHNAFFTWDGHFQSLEKHAPGPIFNSVEMGNNFSNSAQDTVPSGYNSQTGNNDTLFLFGRLDGGSKNGFDRGNEPSPSSNKKDRDGNNYYTLIKNAWGDQIVHSVDRGNSFTTGVAFTMEIIAKSLAAFERKFISTGSPFDAYNAGDGNAINEDAKKGFALFIDPNKANCVSCHSGYNFTDQKFHNDGSLEPGSNPDLGRATVTKNGDDNYKFKTPTLRNISLTAPWMHDGHFPNDQASTELSLEKIVRNYNAGGTGITGAEIKPLGLTDQEIAYIGAFLMSLQDDVFKYSDKLSNPWNN